MQEGDVGAGWESVTSPHPVLPSGAAECSSSQLMLIHLVKKKGSRQEQILWNRKNRQKLSGKVLTTFIFLYHNYCCWHILAIYTIF